ncbi:MAG: zinc-ribbon domain-containing protein [Chloroflexota bacterium]|nr:zinc-ribbon domain-containing protein [Chloroflexota bacterium]MDQ5866075.1 zinc-ribbon domain-containing protein [Chloroflexota bacterium]
MIGGSTSDILAMALPVVLAIVMGILGAARGFRREAIVSGSIVLGALIVQQWASLWATDLYDMYTGVSREMQQVALSQVLMSLIVLVIGYGLGSLVPRGRVPSGSRVGGLLLGLANGSAIGGWLLRYIYTSLDGAQPSSSLYQNVVTQSFMIWAGWFPVALAVVGALVALIAPFRRSEVEVTQTPVATPTPAPVWTPPPPAPAYGATTTTTTNTAYGPPAYGAPAYGAPAYGAPPPSRMSGPVGAATPYDRTVANLSPYATPEARPQPPYDAPRTQAFGGLDVPPPAPARDPYSPNPYNPTPYDTSTRNFSPVTSHEGVAPSTGVLADSHQGSPVRQAPIYRSGIGDTLGTGSTASAADTDNETSQQPATAAPEALRPSSDWLATSTVATQPESAPATAPEGVEEPTAAEQDGGQADREPEMRETEPVASAVGDETRDDEDEAPVAAAAGTPYTPTDVTCANCGATMLSSARFCTECGTPVARA